jgi:hypothetical protein
MSSSGITATNSGPLAIRTYNSGSNKTFILTDYDVPVSTNFVLITSSNGQLVPTNTPTISSIQVSSIRDRDGFTGDSGEVLYTNGSTVFWAPIGAGSGYWTENGSTIYNNNPGNVGIGTNTPFTSTILDVNGPMRLGGFITGNTSSFSISLGSSGTTTGIPRSATIYSDGTDMTIVNQANGSLTLATNNDNINKNITILANGNVGIGNTSPQVTLDILGDLRIGNSYTLANTSSFIVSLGRSGTTGGLPRSALIQSDGKDMTISNQVNGSLAFGTNNFQNNSVLYMSSNGNVGIGTTNPQHTLDVNGRLSVNNSGNLVITSQFGNCFIESSNSASEAGNLLYFTDKNANKVCMIMNMGDAQVGIGTQTINHTLEVGGTINASGDITGANFPTPSDIRLKNTINTIENPLSTLINLRGVSYYLNKDGSKQIGVIAQEVEKVLPEVVKTDTSDEGYKSVTYGNMVALTIEAIKELSKTVNDLNNKVSTLMSK